MARASCSRRKIEISDEYVFTVTQTVENKSPARRGAHSLCPHPAPGHAASFPVTGCSSKACSAGSTTACSEVHYSDVAEQKEPTKIDTTGGWIGFTDKYWAAVIIPDQTKPVTTSFLHNKAGERDLYQTDYLAKDALVVQPGTSASYRDQFFAGAKVVKTINAVADQIRHRRASTTWSTGAGSIS